VFLSFGGDMSPESPCPHDRECRAGRELAEKAAAQGVTIIAQTVTTLPSGRRNGASVPLGDGSVPSAKL